MLSDVDNAKTVKAYRGDIDGLRAIAVISVMLYHFAVWPFTGGFVGVDVFFVISGYLITGGILKDDSHHKFSFSDFYIRRARRLFPALLSTIAISYIVAFLVFSPIDFEKMSGSTVFALFGISNIFFWMSADYFDSASILKPLLHTWSLSVELQFYLIWPALLLILARFGKGAVSVGALAITCAGFALSIYAINNDSTGAYYLTQYRFYEFIAGGLVFLFRRSQLFNKIDRAHTFLFTAGIALVSYPIFAYSANTIFPGVNALTPVLGAMLIILSGDKTLMAKALFLRPVSYIGEISYSLYLIHWPVMVFAQYILVKEFSGSSGLLLTLFSFAIAVPMHRFIEKPLRNPNTFRVSGPAFCLACSCAAMVVMVPSARSWADKGWVWRLPQQIQNVNDFDKHQAERYVWSNQESLAKKKDFDNNGKTRLLILGDSQSADIINMLTESGVIEKYDVVARTILYKCGAPYIKVAERPEYWSKENKQIMQFPHIAKICDKQMDDLLLEGILDKADKIFIAMKWEPYSLSKIQYSIDEISRKTKAKIYLFGNKVLSQSSVDLINSFGRLSGVETYATKFRNRESDRINNSIMKVSGVTYVNMMSLTCPSADSCHVLTDDLQPIFFDAAHLTKSGAKFLGSSLPSVIASAK
ncbi:acyltransferase family protein [Pantoea sp. C3]|uniref:acyltransferase family protein n=1 Tax=Pantoea phytostimulans TaxID=2769024 RepID=UPI0038F65174